MARSVVDGHLQPGDGHQGSVFQQGYVVRLLPPQPATEHLRRLAPHALHRVDQQLTVGVDGDYPAAAVNINLYTGWNMVGYPSITDRQASATLPAQATALAVWQATSPYIAAAPLTTTLHHGNAYWVQVSANCVWTVNP